MSSASKVAIVAVNSEGYPFSPNSPTIIVDLYLKEEIDHPATTAGINGIQTKGSVRVRVQTEHGLGITTNIAGRLLL